MQGLPTVHSCATKQELIQHIEDVHNSVVAFFLEIPTERFADKSFPDGWSIPKNMKHIAATNRLVGLWTALPGFLLKLLGAASKSAKMIEEIEPTNRPVHYDYGKYIRTDKAFSEKEKQKLADEIRYSVKYLIRAVEKHDTEELTGCKAPFGGMNLLTLALFATKHAAFHAEVVRTRLGAS